jgi:uncharacterized membrane protein
MSTTIKLLTASEEAEIVEAIRLAEQKTSGEIRVHIESSAQKDPFKRAKEVFELLQMDATALQNGVLIYLAYEDHQFTICGDKGINNLVAADFWDCTRDIMQEHFRNGNFKQGLLEGILRVGERLKQHFPRTESDLNELSNDISNG